MEWKIEMENFWKKEELKVKKMEIKNINFCIK